VTEIQPRQAAVTNWLLSEGARSESPQALLESFAHFLVGLGIPLHRLALTMAQLNPVIRGVTFEWVRGAKAFEIQRRRDTMTSRVLAHSPIGFAMRTGEPLRRRLVGPDAELDFPVLEELRDKGITDYYIVPHNLTQPLQGGMVVYNSDRQEGFDDAHIQLFRAITPVFLMVGQIHGAHRSIKGLLTAYVGQEPAQRILDGEVVQGIGHTVRALVWLCDLRGFTTLSETLARDEMLGLLNSYFSAAVESVTEAGGEVLKFMGDAILAIFRCEKDDCDAATRALAASRALMRRLAEINAERGGGNFPKIECGIALHLGPVTYGNIGSPDRLDFTVIGPTVNLVSRLAQLCKPLGEQIVLSAEAAKAAGSSMRSLGRHAFKGLLGEREAFAPAAAFA
jgi:adenylate cyclase